MERHGRTQLARTVCGVIGAALVLGVTACQGEPPVPTATTGTTSAATAEPRPADAVAEKAELTFKRYGKVVATRPLTALQSAVAPVTVEQYDPYYNREKRFRALPLADVVRAGFGDVVPEEELQEAEFVFRALDGYTVPFRGAQVFEAGGHIAIADLDHPNWELIGPQRANPAPFYLIWSEKNQLSLETHPRPWQLSVIEIARFADTFPHVVPKELVADSPEAQGLSLFRRHCILCHAINRQGGRVGPELNVPQSIVEYRPREQIRAYIKNPLAFRYGNMPAHPFLSDGDLDALMAYFDVMAEQKHDPEGADAGTGAH